MKKWNIKYSWQYLSYKNDADITDNTYKVLSIYGMHGIISIVYLSC
jgi:hypothetical protein